jgi:hypothetical protein
MVVIIGEVWDHIGMSSPISGTAVMPELQVTVGKWNHNFL